MMAEAEANAGADKARRELVEAKNHAEALIHQTEKQVVEHGDKVTDAVKGEIEKAIADLKTAAAGDNAADIQAKHQSLMTAAMKLGEAIYAAAGTAAAEADSAKDDGVVDADFEEVDDAKRA
jgi:molecular chaperone DnaK